MPSTVRYPLRAFVTFAAGLLLALAVGLPGPAAGQTAVVAVDENLREEPNGPILGRLHEGTRVRVEGAQGGWTRVTAEGMVFIPSLQVHSEGGFDLVVSASEGENLRDGPGGRVAGRFERGTLLEELERIPGWIRVRRTAWIWTQSIRFEEAAPAPPAAGRAAPPAPPPEQWVRAGPGGAPILISPDGDTLAHARPRVDLPVLAREGNWARVRVEGWIWVPAAAPDEADEEVVLRDVRAPELASDPDRFRGRVVELELQFISVERADRIRTDFHEGEPFLLTRATDQDRTFVYVAVPPDRIQEVERLAPLERIRVVGRVRTGAAALTGNPVLELVDLRPLR